jgi:hypothetical protein
VIGALIAAALVGVVSAITGSFGTVNGQALFTVFLFAAFAFMSWYDADVSAKRAVWFGAVSLAVSVYLLVAGVAKIWFTPDDYWDEFLAWIWLAIIARIALLHIHLLLFIYRKYVSPGMRLVSIATFVLVGVLAVMLSLPALFRSVEFADGYWRAIAVVAILDSLGTILVPLVYSLFHRQPAAARAPLAPGALPGYVPPVVQPAPVAHAAAAAPAEAIQRPDLPPPTAYAPWDESQPKLRLRWPQYEDGRPLPRKPDGTPDFTGVVGF